MTTLPQSPIDWSRAAMRILRADALPADVHRVATNAMQRGCAAVVVAPVYVKRVATMLAGATRTCAAVSFPHGTSKPTLKAIEATSAIKDGADEVVVVPHLPALVRRDFDALKFEMFEIVRAARATRRDVVIHVILESALLMANVDAGEAESRVADACRAIRESGCDGVTTCTGFHPAGGAVVEAVALVRKHGTDLILTAAGDVATLDAARAMLDAGADRVELEESVA